MVLRYLLLLGCRTIVQIRIPADVLFDDEVDAIVSLTGATDDGCVLKSRFPELLEGITGLFFWQGHEQTAAGLGIKENFLSILGG